MTSPDGGRTIEPHIYASGIVGNEKLRENVLAFAARNGFSIAGPTIDYSDTGEYETIRETLRAAKDRGIENVMINNGRLGDRSARTLATDADAMDEHVRELREVIDVYTEYYPDGRVFAFHEAPLFGGWNGETLAEMTDDVLEYGPEIFRAQKSLIAEVAPGVDVGIFVHHPLLPGPDHTSKPIFEDLTDRLADLGSLPDFTYVDMYRGYYEWEAGYGGVNEYLASIIDNVSEQTDGRPIHYLGEAHTINNHYTPSKQAILGNFRTALEAGVDGYGWYVRGSRRRTHERCYNPFLPNRGEDGGPEAFDTWTGSRDRMLWANLLTAEHATDVAHDDRFDLWLYGQDFGFYEHGLRLLASDGEREFIGDFSGYVDGPYSSSDRPEAAVFHGLSRKRFLSNGRLELEIDSRRDGDGSTLIGAYVVPHLGTTHYRTEPEVARTIDGRDGIPESCLGAIERDDALRPGSTYNEVVAIDEPNLRIEETALGRTDSDLARLRRIEASDGFDHSDRFDLWISGTDLENVSISLRESGPGWSERDVTDRADATTDESTESGALVLRGLEKDEWYANHSTGSFVGISLEADGERADVEAIYAMPYHGSYNFKTPAEVAAIVDREHEEGRWQINTFSLGRSVSPAGSALAENGEFETWVYVDDRHIYESEPFDYHPSLPWPPWYLE